MKLDNATYKKQSLEQIVTNLMGIGYDLCLEGEMDLATKCLYAIDSLSEAINEIKFNLKKGNYENN